MKVLSWLSWVERLLEVRRIRRDYELLMQACVRCDTDYINKMPEHLKSCSDEQLAEIKASWKPYESVYPNNPLLQVILSRLSGRFDPLYIPFGLQFHILSRFWNHSSFSVFRSKNYSRILFPFVKSPENVVTCSYGIYRDTEGNVLTLRDAVLKIYMVLKNEKELIIKPALDSGDGEGIVFLTDKDTTQRIAEVVRQKTPDFVCQKILKNHPGFCTGENACNTLRVVTLVDGSEVLWVGAMWRMAAGKRVDNFNAGGIACAVDLNGICGDFAISGNGSRLEEHPNGFKFKGHKLFKADEIIATAIKCHKRIMQQKYISWDFTVDEAGDIVFIEMNSPGSSEGMQGCGMNSYINRDIAKKIFDEYIYFAKATMKWNYREYSDHVYLMKYYGNAKKVVIPEFFMGKKVTLLAGGAFDDSRVTEVVKSQDIPFAVTIGKRGSQITVQEI